MTRMLHRMSLAFVFCAAAVFVAACNNSTSSDIGASSTTSNSAKPESSPADPPRVVGTELPVKITSAQPDVLSDNEVIKAEPLADVNTSLLNQVQQKLRQATLLMARVPSNIGITCKGGRINSKANETTDCQAAYKGLTVDWKVTIKSTVGTFIEYTAIRAKTIVTAKNAYNQFWIIAHNQSDELRCDEMPEAFLVDHNLSAVDTGFNCQSLGPVVHNNRAWKNYRLVAYGDRIGFR
jgi:hypothetical protein